MVALTKPGNTVAVIGLKFENGKVGYSQVAEYQLVNQYTVETAGALRLFPDGYKFFSGRRFQWNKKFEQYEYFSGAIIAEFTADGEKFYVSGEHFYAALEKAILMKNYILNNKPKEKE